ncbi:MAG TPA: hypothetical protein VNQ53_00130 [Nocardioides sp.]|nr:hypothetical protein [Nocardioides sp.]
MASTLLRLLDEPDPVAIRERLTDEVRFRSPVADYEGRDDVAHLIATMGVVLEAVEPAREFEVGPEHTTFIAGSVSSHRFDGVIDEILDEDGRVVEVTLMLRPMAVLHVAVKAMAAALDESPLPSRP